MACLLDHLKAYGLEAVLGRPKYFTSFAQRGHMLLNANTLANLEIFRNQTNFKTSGTLFAVLDHTQTPFGQRMLRQWAAKPLLAKEALQARIDAVDEILNSSSYLLGKLRGLLKGLPDLERGLARIHYGKSSPQELVRVFMAFQRIGDEFPTLSDDNAKDIIPFQSPMLNEAFKALPKVRPVVQEFLESARCAQSSPGSQRGGLQGGV